MLESASVLPARLHSVPEAAEFLGVSTDHMRRLIRQNELPVVRIGRRLLVHPDDLSEFIDKHRG